MTVAVPSGALITSAGTTIVGPQARTSPTVLAPSAPATAARANIREAGYANDAGSWWNTLAEEASPELRWPMAMTTFDRMRRSDAQVTSVLRAVTLPIRRTRWYLDPAGADPAVVRLVAEDLGLSVDGVPDADLAPLRSRDRFTWAEHLALALEMLVFGHAYFEQLYRIDDAGYARLRKLGYRPATTLSAINVAPDGGLVSIEQRALVGDRGQRDPIPVSKLVAYVHERTGGNWRGTSLVRPAYKHWLLKDRLLRVQTETIERNGMGVPRYTGAEGETNLDRGEELAQRWRSGNSAGAAIDYGAKLDLVGVTGDLPDAEPAIRYHDEQIGRAVLAHFLNLNAQGGSYALASVQADTFTQSLQALAQQVADVATQHIVEDLVDANFGPTARAPRVVFEEIGSRQVATAAAVKLLVDAGVLRPDPALEQAMRSNLHLPDVPPSAGAVPPEPHPAPDPGPETEGS